MGPASVNLAEDIINPDMVNDKGLSLLWRRLFPEEQHATVLASIVDHEFAQFLLLHGNKNFMN